ncbi:hypothetical protein K1719_007361 [Acacia pycnantha]|nr:hypothetical protein K1719_007361 [Acacia pycnantha]
MDLSRGFFESANKSYVKHLRGGGIALYTNSAQGIKISGASFFVILSRAILMAMVLVTLPSLGSILKEGFSSSSQNLIYSGIETANTGLFNAQMLNSLLHDFAEEGLLRKDDKGLIVNPSNGFEGVIAFRGNEFDGVMDSDLQTRSSFSDESYDFVFTSSPEDVKFVDRIMKNDGILAFPLGLNPSISFKQQTNYRVVYHRRYSSIIVGLKKINPDNKIVESSTRRKLFQLESADEEAKKMALRGLEDVLLEPPKPALAKSKIHMKSFKYLPDLTGDSLEGYKRRVFIVVGSSPEENRGVIEWFQKNYPKKNKKFSIHNIQDKPYTDVSSWLLKRVKKEDYVVMKVEASEVENIIEKRAISLVDELFLECKNEWWQVGKRKKKGRAYWECLALYGRLRDKGVAVHQWWGLPREN